MSEPPVNPQPATPAPPPPTPKPAVQPIINPLTGQPMKPSKLGPDATILQRIRARLPSRNWAIFWTVTFGAVALANYDSHQSKKIREEFAERVKELRERPVNPTDRFGSVLVLIGPPVNHDDGHMVREAFRKHIKPVFDSAALEYQLLESKPTPHLRNEIRRRVHKLKRPPPGPDEFGMLPDPPLDLGIVCVGRAAWRDTLLGLQDGMASPPLLDIEEEVERDWMAWKAKERRFLKSDGPDPGPQPVKPSPAPVAPANVESAPVIPPLGFIPYHNRIGWYNMPRRLFAFFTERWVAREMGEKAVEICLGKTRPFRDEDEELGYKEEEQGRTAGKKGRDWEVVGEKIGIWDEVKRKLRVFDGKEGW